MMENLNNKIPAIKLEEYSLLDFSSEPKQLEKYKIGEKITRENFNDFLMQSFAISRGQSIVQMAYFEWLQKTTGFDYAASLKKFVKSGGFKILTSQEQQNFMDAFMPIKKHATLTGMSLLNQDPANTVLRSQITHEINQLGFVDEKDLWVTPVYEQFFDMQKIVTYQDFTNAKNLYFESLKH